MPYRFLLLSKDWEEDEIFRRRKNKNTDESFSFKLLKLLALKEIWNMLYLSGYFFDYIIIEIWKL